MTSTSRLVLLLPETRRFQGQGLSADLARRLGRADRLTDAEPGERAQLLRHFQIDPPGWPMAALLRQREAGDAEGTAWLRADPAYLRAEMTGARLMAWGDLGLSAQDADELLAELQPVFGEAGLSIGRTRPESWYVGLPDSMDVPRFSPPSEALGGQLMAHLPEGDEGRTWRRLANEAQVLLHHHPINARRQAAGRVPVNSLWFWGEGRLPDRVHAQWDAVLGADEALAALAQAAGIGAQPVEEGKVLVDLRRECDFQRVESRFREALGWLASPRSELLLDFADGIRFHLAAAQRWRWWRSPLHAFDA